MLYPEANLRRLETSILEWRFSWCCCCIRAPCADWRRLSLSISMPPFPLLSLPAPESAARSPLISFEAFGADGPSRLAMLFTFRAWGLLALVGLDPEGAPPSREDSSCIWESPVCIWLVRGGDDTLLLPNRLARFAGIAWPLLPLNPENPLENEAGGGAIPAAPLLPLFKKASNWLGSNRGCADCGCCWRLEEFIPPKLPRIDPKLPPRAAATWLVNWLVLLLLLLKELPVLLEGRFSKPVASWSKTDVLLIFGAAPRPEPTFAEADTTAASRPVVSILLVWRFVLRPDEKDVGTAEAALWLFWFPIPVLLLMSTPARFEVASAPILIKASFEGS